MIKKLILPTLIICLVILTGITHAAAPDTLTVTNTKSPKAPVFTIPDKAIRVTDNIFSLGSAFDPGSQSIVEGYMIIHKKTPDARPESNQKTGRPGACYTYLSKGAKWKNTENWIMNSDNHSGLNSGDIFTILDESINKWEDATDGIINNNVSTDILGQGTTTNSTLSADNSAPDNENEVYFANIDDASTIAVTTVWGILSGPVEQKKLVEWDMVFDDVKFDWSTTGEQLKMDLENIATHELGHAVGMGDLYNNCVNETMYGIADNGETNKRDLNTGDITGISLLY